MSETEAMLAFVAARAMTERKSQEARRITATLQQNMQELWDREYQALREWRAEAEAEEIWMLAHHQRVVIPYTVLVPEVRAGAPEAECIEMTSETSYYDLIEESWDTGIIIIEHDIVASSEIVADLRSCPHKWCVIPYRGPGGLWLDRSLGCTKLGPFPFPLRLIPDKEPFPLTDWRRLDHRIAALLETHGVQRHVHGLAVRHLHKY